MSEKDDERGEPSSDQELSGGAQGGLGSAPTERAVPEPVADDPGTGGAPPESYEAAVARLDEIIARLDSGKAELRETLGLVREGKALVEYCKAELDAVSGELEKLDLDSLVAQLESAEGE